MARAVSLFDYLPLPAGYRIIGPVWRDSGFLRDIFFAGSQARERAARKRGRPPKSGKAMSGAERARAFRARQREAGK